MALRLAEDQRPPAPVKAASTDEKLARLHALGATHVALRLFWPGMTQKEALAMIELVAAKLLPFDLHGLTDPTRLAEVTRLAAPDGLALLERRRAQVAAQIRSGTIQ